MDENKLFLKIVEEKFQRFKDYYVMMNSDFLTLEQQSLLAGFMRTARREGTFFYGGYGDAERRMVIFLPDYTGVTSEEELQQWCNDNPDDCPLAVLDIKVPAQERGKLSHRDYLGALMGEGIKREKVGDILVSEDGAQIIVAKEMAEYLAQNYRQVGRVSLCAEIIPISGLNTGEIKVEHERFSLPSPRLDNIVSGAFNIARKDAVEAISRGKVFVNGVEMSKPDYALKGGEKVVLRGKGKIIYQGERGTSRKGKTYVEIIKYI
ncbi:MAG: hypothetical protein IKW01_04545 [Firmicutes bacterium]|nr:hypothetical protein [Bacillota bacterium]